MKKKRSGATKTSAAGKRPTVSYRVVGSSSFRLSEDSAKLAPGAVFEGPEGLDRRYPGILTRVPDGA